MIFISKTFHKYCIVYVMYIMTVANFFNILLKWDIINQVNNIKMHIRGITCLE